MSRPLSEIVDAIRAHHRLWLFAENNLTRANNALLGFTRAHFTSWRHGCSEIEHKKAASEARQIVDKAREGVGPAEIVVLVTASDEQQAPMRALLDAHRKELERLAKQLPVWETFGKDVRGLGPKSLSAIVGEAGDLSNYATVGKLWKRLGVAVLDGVRQGGLSKGATSEDWIRHGYRAKRRAQLFVIGTNLVKHGIRAPKEDGAAHTVLSRYGAIYLQRKALEAERVASKLHADKRARRYMEKRFIKHLWLAWRKASAVNSEQERARLAVSDSDQLAPAHPARSKTRTGRAKSELSGSDHVGGVRPVLDLSISNSEQEKAKCRLSDPDQRICAHPARSKTRTGRATLPVSESDHASVAQPVLEPAE